MEWKHGGGYIALALLFGVISWIWKSMTSKDEEKSDTAEIKSVENIQNSGFMNENEGKKTASIETAAEQAKSPEEQKSKETVNEEQIVRPRMHWLPMTVLILNLISAIIQIFPAIGISYVGTTFRVINILTVLCAILFIVGMLCKKRWALIGFFIYRIVGFFMIVSYFGMYDDTAVVKNLCGTILIIIVFCFKRDGYNVFDLLWNNGVINEKPIVTPNKNETMAIETMKKVVEENEKVKFENGESKNAQNIDYVKSEKTEHTDNKQNFSLKAKEMGSSIKERISKLNINKKKVVALVLGIILAWLLLFLNVIFSDEIIDGYSRTWTFKHYLPIVLPLALSCIGYRLIDNKAVFAAILALFIVAFGVSSMYPEDFWAMGKRHYSQYYTDCQSILYITCIGLALGAFLCYLPQLFRQNNGKKDKCDD
jgi:hypothetical protein